MSHTVEVRVPFENVNDSSAKLVGWEVKSGQEVTAGQLLCRLETTKAVYDVCAPSAGLVRFTLTEGTEVPVGDVVARIESAVAGTASVQPTQPAEVVRSAPPTDGAALVRSGGAEPATGAGPLFSRKAEALRAQLGLSPELFAGLGMVGEAEVRAVAQKAGAATSTSGGSAGSADDGRFETLIPLERIKLYETRELLAAERAVLRSALHRRCRAGDLGLAAARRDPPVSRLALVLFELAQALRAHRRLNATLRDTAIAIYREINLGFAVDMGRGLKVLVVPQADRLTVEQVHEVTEDLLVKYATDALAVADVTGSTFTLTDLSAEGVEAFAPLLNREQAAILGLGADAGGTGGLTLSCAFDHRILGGREVAVFLSELATRLEASAPVKGAEPKLEEEPLCAWCLRGRVELRPLRAALIPSVEPAGYVCSICFNGLG